MPSGNILCYQNGSLRCALFLGNKDLAYRHFVICSEIESQCEFAIIVARAANEILITGNKAQRSEPFQ